VPASDKKFPDFLQKNVKNSLGGQNVDNFWITSGQKNSKKFKKIQKNSKIHEKTQKNAKKHEKAPKTQKSPSGGSK
jgi:Mg2+ and Co2+ transporter CorA